MNRNFAWVVLIGAAVVGAYCYTGQCAPAAKSRPAAAANSQPASSTRPAIQSRPVAAVPTSNWAGGAVMATVNDQPIYMAQLDSILLQSFGLPIAKELVADEMVRQEAAKHNLDATDADLAAESDRELVSMFGADIDPAQRQRLLDQLLTRKGFSRAQWDLIVRRNALLGKLADLQVKVTDDQVHKEFAEEFGRRVIVLLIECESLAAAQDVLQRLKNKEDFAELARKVSRNPSAMNGGLLPAIGAVAFGMPPVLRDAALAMKTPGEIAGPIAFGTSFHILKLDKVIEPQNNVKFEDVKDKLYATVHNQLNDLARKEIYFNYLPRATRIEYVDPTLKALSIEQGQGQ